MSEITTIGLDLAKQVFQVHAVEAAGAVALRRQLKRRQVVPFFAKLPRCLIGLEACGTAHHWGRTLQALGHEVRLIPPAGACPWACIRGGCARPLLHRRRPRQSAGKRGPWRSPGPACRLPRRRSV